MPNPEQTEFSPTLSKELLEMSNSQTLEYIGNQKQEILNKIFEVSEVMATFTTYKGMSSRKFWFLKEIRDALDTLENS